MQAFKPESTLQASTPRTLTALEQEQSLGSLTRFLRLVGSPQRLGWHILYDTALSVNRSRGAKIVHAVPHLRTIRLLTVQLRTSLPRMMIPIHSN